MFRVPFESEAVAREVLHGNLGGGDCVARRWKPLPYFRSNYVIFPTLFQTSPKIPNPISDQTRSRPHNPIQTSGDYPGPWIHPDCSRTVTITLVQTHETFWNKEQNAAG